MPVREPTCSTFSRLGRLPLRLLPPLLLATLLLFLPCHSFTLVNAGSGTGTGPSSTASPRTGDYPVPPHLPQPTRANLQIKELPHRQTMTPPQQRLKLGATSHVEEEHTGRHRKAHLEGMGDRKESTMRVLFHARRRKQWVSARQSTESNVKGQETERAPFRYRRVRRGVDSSSQVRNGRMSTSLKHSSRPHITEEEKRDMSEIKLLQELQGPSNDPGAALSAGSTHALHQFPLKSSRQLLYTGADTDKAAVAESLSTGRINHHSDTTSKGNNRVLTEKPISSNHHSHSYDSTVDSLRGGQGDLEKPLSMAAGRKLLSTENPSTFMVDPLPASLIEAIAEDDPVEDWNETVTAPEPDTLGRQLRDLMTDLGRQFHRGRGSRTAPLIRLLRGPWLLAVNTNGSVYVTKDVSDENTVFLSRNVDDSLVTLQGREARKFLTFSKKGQLTATRRMNRRTHFISLHSRDHSMSYLSKSGQKKSWYIGVTDNGDLTTYSEKRTHRRKHRKSSTTKPVPTSEANTTYTATDISDITSVGTSLDLSTISEGLTEGPTVRSHRRRHHKKKSQRRRGRRKCRSQKCTCLRNRHLAPWCQFRMVPLDGHSHMHRT